MDQPTEKDEASKDHTRRQGILGEGIIFWIRAFFFEFFDVKLVRGVWLAQYKRKEIRIEVTVNPVCPDGKNWQSYILLPSVMAANPLYQQVYALWLTNIVMVFLPFLTLLILNAYIAYTIRKSLEKFDNHQQ
ncbi:hypothetical protein GCK32_020632, partial [Trichostrongylus colubriformis]